MFKHAVWLALLDDALAAPGPLTVIDTHAGAGLYDLGAEANRRSGEAAAGVRRLLEARPGAPRPPPLEALARAVAACRRRAGEGAYPGSPLLAAGRLRPGDRFLGWELRPDDHTRLATALRTFGPQGSLASALLGDGYAEAPGIVAPRRLVMIDPPYERDDERARIAACLAALHRTPGALATAVWAPLKDLETLDRLAVEVAAAAARPGWMIELRTRPLDNPLRLNGSALLVHGAPQVEATALETAAWLADTLGEPGARAVAVPLAGPLAARQPRA